MWDYLKEWFAGFNLPQLNIPSIGFTELLDIAIVAFLLYKILQWIRKTRAWSLLKGILLIVVFAALAYFLNLVTVLWIVQNSLAMGLIVIVILFQPELRKALEQIGKGIDFLSLNKYDSTKSTKITDESINEIAKAMSAMSKAKTGALICIEKDVTLKEHEQAGVIVDAHITSQILINIFEVNTPLHDGAVIIRFNRVSSAACVLPLSNEEIGGDLGTRHRAAVGLTEESDAIALVVSEETGIMSVSESGKLLRNQNEIQIADILTKTFLVEKIKPLKHGRRRNGDV